MTDEILMTAAQMTPNDLVHHGVKGQKWGVRRTPAELAAASGGPGGGASVEDVDELEEKISENEQKLAEMKADGADEKEIRAMEASIKAGKERVNQILDAERRNGAAFEHAMSFTPDEVFTGLAEDELFFEHHGIKGQKWGIRRFQPYRQGMKVAGGKVVGAAKKVKQRFKDIGDARQKKKAAKAKAEAAKKAQATRKANADFETEKKKAIESGSVEDLAKFKGKLTNEEYSRAFLRLQNEKKLSDMVAANEKTFWDTIDKGMNIVQKVGGYANTIANAKENFTKLDKAFNGEHDKKVEDDKKAAKEAAKKEFMNTATYEELVKNNTKYGLDTKDYNMVVARIKGEEPLRKEYDAKVAADKAQKEAEAAQRKETNARGREQAESLKNSYYKVPEQRPKAESAPEPEPEEERKTRYTAKRTGLKSSSSKYRVRTIAGHK